MPSVFLLVFASHGLLLLGCSILKSVSVSGTIVPVSLLKWRLYGPSGFLRVHNLFWAFPVRALAFLKPWDHDIGRIRPQMLTPHLHGTASVVAALCSIPYPVLTVPVSSVSTAVLLWPTLCSTVFIFSLWTAIRFFLLPFLLLIVPVECSRLSSYEIISMPVLTECLLLYRGSLTAF